MNAPRTALICGASGQDGAHLAALLLTKGYRVVGTSRDAQAQSPRNLIALGINEKVELKSMALNDFRKSRSWDGMPRPMCQKWLRVRRKRPE